MVVDLDFTAERLLPGLDLIDEGVAHFDSNLSLKAWNRAFARIASGLGVTVRENLPHKTLFPEALNASGEPSPVIEYQKSQGFWLRLKQSRTSFGGLICVCTDISQVKQADERAESLKHFFDELINFIPAQIVVKDSHRRYLKINNAVTAVTGFSRDEMIGRTAADIYSDEVASTLYNVDSQAVASPGTIISSINSLNIPIWGNRYVRKLVVATPEINDDFYIISVMEDITDHRNAELALEQAKQEAEQANLAKSVFLTTMTHEIRTPLNGVLGMAQVMAMDSLDPTQRERLEVLRQSGEALLAILNDILDLSKIEAGKLTLEEIAFDIGETLHGAIQSYQSLTQAKGLVLSLDIGNATGVYLGDPTRIRQILYNLVSNALKFTETGAIDITANYVGENLRISVADTGLGIPADKLDKLFAKFSQVDETITRRFGGTGLGLSICKELAELMGGEIKVESIEGEGACFTFELPLKRVGESAESDASSAPSHNLQPGALRILAAEDNATNQLVLKTLLGFAGVEVEIVSNGAQALDAWAREPWDVILMDVQMPVMDGVAATREIRRREAVEGRSRTPIIALTANTMAHQIAEYIAIGMDSHVSKPIEADRLYQALADL